jgi:hypothetical protein
MSDLSEISDLERAFHELQRIKQQINLLSDFLGSKLKDQERSRPRASGMIDPRTGKPFRGET